MFKKVVLNPRILNFIEKGTFILLVKKVVLNMPKMSSFGPNFGKPIPYFEPAPPLLVIYRFSSKTNDFYCCHVLILPCAFLSCYTIFRLLPRFQKYPQCNTKLCKRGNLPRVLCNLPYPGKLKEGAKLA